MRDAAETASTGSSYRRRLLQLALAGCATGLCLALPMMAPTVPMAGFCVLGAGLPIFCLPCDPWTRALSGIAAGICWAASAVVAFATTDVRLALAVPLLNGLMAGVVFGLAGWLSRRKA